MKQGARRSDDNPRRSTMKAEYDSETLALSSIGVNPHAQLESNRAIGECNNKLTVNVVEIVLKLSNEIRILR